MRYRPIPKILSVAVACMLLSTGLSGMEKSEGRGDIQRKPYPYKAVPAEALEWDRGLFRLSLRARSFAQGNAVYAEIIASPSTDGLPLPGLFYDGRSVPLAKRDRGYAGLFAIAPDERPGKKQLAVSWEQGGKMVNYHFELMVKPTGFRKYPRPINLGRFSNISLVAPPEVFAFIEECSRKKKEVFDRSTPYRLKGPVCHPRDAHFITSPFWAGRKYQRYRVVRGKRIYLEPSSNAHSGVDLRGETGDPVFAMLGGRVAIARAMYYEGNYIVIDHGNRIFSSYMHLDGFAVREGQKVGAGDLVGFVGSTGLSTGAHLHVSFSVEGIYVDPLSLLYAVPR